MLKATRHLDLVLAASFAVLLALVVALPDWNSPARVALGLVNMFAVPGYALCAAIFPKRRQLGALERIVLSLVLSVVSVALIGLILNYSPWGLRFVPVVVSLSACSLAFAAAAYLRRSRVPAHAAFRIPVEDRPFRIGVLLGLGTIGTFFMLFAVAPSLRPHQGFTEFYVLGDDGSIGGYPERLVAGERYAMVFGIGNHESREQRYEIRGVTADGPGALLKTVVVEPGTSWEERRQLTAPVGDGRTVIPFHLYRQGDDRPYRSLQLVVDLEGSDTGAVRE